LRSATLAIDGQSDLDALARVGDALVIDIPRAKVVNGASPEASAAVEGETTIDAGESSGTYVL